MKIQILFCLSLFCALVLTSSGCSDDFANESVTLSTDGAVSVRSSNDPVRRAYRDNFDTWYNFVPDIAGGWNPMNPAPFPAWYPGGGEGHATHMGNVKAYFNQYVTFIFCAFDQVTS